MAALGLAPDTKDPNGGWFDRDGEGKVNGRAHENAEYALHRRFADLATEEDLADNIQAFSDEAVPYASPAFRPCPS